MSKLDNFSHFKFSCELITELQQELKSNLTYTTDHQILGLASNLTFNIYILDFKAVLITGLSGIGKTSLSLHISHILSRDKDCYACKVVLN